MWTWHKSLNHSQSESSGNCLLNMFFCPSKEARWSWHRMAAHPSLCWSIWFLEKRMLWPWAPWRVWRRVSRAETPSPQVWFLCLLSKVKNLQRKQNFLFGSCPEALDSPQSLAAVNVTDVSALLLWQPSVATVDGYIITLSAESGVFLGE